MPVIPLSGPRAPVVIIESVDIEAALNYVRLGSRTMDYYTITSQGSYDLGLAKIKQITHDNRKVFSQVYTVKPGHVYIEQIPKLQYISQEMNTAFHMDWAGRPEPLSEQWIVWKIVNQLKQITKNSFEYKFKLMPPEIIWHKSS